jgi:hypothetical protein
MIKISGLTTNQVILLNKIWSCKTLDEYILYRSRLAPDKKQEVDTLALMLQEEINFSLHKIKYFDNINDVLNLCKNKNIPK